MPLAPPAHREERRIAAERARLARLRHIATLRRQVMAAALSTFALAFGLVAFDGSMGAQTASSAAASSASAPSAAAPVSTPNETAAETLPDSAPAPVSTAQS